MSAALLRDLLAAVIDGSRKAVRLRTEGRSTARGSQPSWIDKAVDFTVTIGHGSTKLDVKAPTLLESNPDEFGQVGLFPEINPLETSFDYFAESLAAALEGDARSSLYDRALLKSFRKMGVVFAEGADTIRLQNGGEVSITAVDLKSLSILEASIPAPRYVRLSGKLDAIRHSDHTFSLTLADSGASIRGIAESSPPSELQSLWGKPVIISGNAHFTASGGILRVDADRVASAEDRDLQLWSQVPRPFAQATKGLALRQPQGPRSGLNAIIGQWPGDESDEEIIRALEEAS